MPLVATRGAASAQGFGEFAVTSTPTYIEDVFSCFLYTGTSSPQTITNGIDLSTEGGLVWIRIRTLASDHQLFDTARGATKRLFSNLTDAELTTAGTLNSFDTTGFSLGTQSSVNFNTYPYVSWTFRKQPKFFDIVTWTGSGANTTIAHNLGSVPGCIIVKDISTSNGYWAVYHRSTGANYFTYLNDTSAASTGSTYWNNTSPTSTVFTVGTNADVNASGVSYVAYVFAHDAGGFGLTGSDNVISCGSYTGSSNTPQQITLGYEPQWVLLKKSSTTDEWRMFDNMRGMALSTGGNSILEPNTTNAEAASSNWILPNATGFVAGSSATDSATYIYIAIRRGPMKVPTSGTSVFSPQTSTTDGFVMTTNFPVDLFINKQKDGTDSWYNTSRLTDRTLFFNSTASESNYSAYINFDSNTSATIVAGLFGAQNRINYAMQRAPSFFDVVCYTGNGSSNNAKTHNLGVAPELLIIKNRSSSASGDWYTFHTFTSSNFKKQLLDTTDSQTNYTYGSFLDAQPTSTTFTVNSGAGCNESGVTYVAYLFATCAGVSKVGSYTGNGSSQTINCGFTGGARFVMIKATSTTGNWIVADSARGIVAGNDPALYLNSTAAEVTGLDWIDADNSGFVVNETATIAANTNGVSYIFFAVA